MRRSPLLAVPLALAAAAGLAPAADARSARLPAFDTCSELVDFGRTAALRPPVVTRALASGGLIFPRAIAPEPKPVPPRTTPDGIPVPMPMPGAPVAAAEAPASAGADSGGTTEFSTTNVQEQGIDEPDVVKTDGKRLFVVVGQELWAYDVTGAAPKLLSKLSLEGAGGELLLRGDRLLLLGAQPDSPVAQPLQASQPAPPVSVPAPPVVGTPAPGMVTPPPAKARLAEIDVRDPAAMKIVRTMAVPGTVISARLTKGTIRVVLDSPADLPYALTPEEPGTDQVPVTDGQARAAAKKLGKRDFVPRTTLHSRRTKRTFRRDLVACDEVRHPTRPAGTSLLTVLTVDFDDGLFNVDRDAVLAGAQVVYASEGSLYVGSYRATELGAATDVPRGMVTELHRFDASQTGQTTYAGGGTVPGFVLNQYSLSESAAGDLRVATTQIPEWVPGAMSTSSQSHVTVLRPDGRGLKEIGRVSGLGLNERIYATRFIGDRAYVVTFRRTDPLYTVDLSDPTAPKVAGELKIPGYSAYLHPIGEDLLLGVGMDASDTGRVTGAQVSMFDVSNPAAPTRLHQVALGSGEFAAEFDPHAFLWWPQRKLTLLPYSGYNRTTYRSDASVVGFTADKAAGFAEVGRITHGPLWDRGRIIRSTIVGSRVITLSELGIGTSALDGLGAVDFQPFVAAG